MNNINIKIEKDNSDNISESHEELLKPSQVIQKFESINKEILLKQKQKEEKPVEIFTTYYQHLIAVSVV